MTSHIEAKARAILAIEIERQFIDRGIGRDGDGRFFSRPAVATKIAAEAIRELLWHNGIALVESNRL